MSDWSIILQFILNGAVQAWTLIMSVWWLALPIFATIVLAVLKLIWSIQPSDDNRKQ